MPDLDGKIALVTGAGSGLGREIALTFARAGAVVGVNDLRAAAAGAVHEELAAPGAALACGPLVGDVSDSAAVRGWFEAVARATGGGSTSWSTTRAMRMPIPKRSAASPSSSRRRWRAAQHVERGDPAYDRRALDPHARRPPERHLLRHAGGAPPDGARGQRAHHQHNMASIAGTTGIASVPHYSAAKGGIIAFTKAVAREVAVRGILVNAIAPGYIDTPILDVIGEARAAYSALIAMQTPLARLGEAREVAATALFLAGSGGSFFTRQVLSPNGGLVI